MHSPPQSPTTHIANRRTEMGEHYTPTVTATEFSSLHDGFLETPLPFKAYLTKYAQDAIPEMAESPVHMLVKILAADKNGLSRSSNLTDVGKFLSVYFIPDIVSQIVCYYEGLQRCIAMPPTYLRRCSLSQIGKSVALGLRNSYSMLDIKAQFVRVDEGSSGGSSSRACQGQGGGGADQGANQAGDQGGGAAGQGSGGRPCQCQGQCSTNSRGNHGGRRGGGGRRYLGPPRPLCPEGQRFRDIIPTIIEVNTFVTPKTFGKERKSIIHNAAKVFHFDPVAQRFQAEAYDPYELVSPDSTDKIRFLFHGTRKSHLSGFKINGVSPPWSPNELSSEQAFYVTNSIEQAVAHVLYVCPKCPSLTADPIIILVFAVDTTVLNGDRPSPLNSSNTFSSKWFEHDDPEHCQEFIKDADHHLRLHEPSHDPFLNDFLIAPICLPGSTQSTILNNWTTNQDIYLTQIAACTKPAYNFFSSC